MRRRRYVVIVCVLRLWSLTWKPQYSSPHRQVVSTVVLSETRKQQEDHVLITTHNRTTYASGRTFEFYVDRKEWPGVLHLLGWAAGTDVDWQSGNQRKSGRKLLPAPTPLVQLLLPPLHQMLQHRRRNRPPMARDCNELDGFARRVARGASPCWPLGSSQWRCRLCGRWALCCWLAFPHFTTATAVCCPSTMAGLTAHCRIPTT